MVSVVYNFIVYWAVPYMNLCPLYHHVLEFSTCNFSISDAMAQLLCNEKAICKVWLVIK